MRILFLIIFSISCLHSQANEKTISDYLQLVESFPKLVDSQGDYRQGEIEIILDPIEMASIERTTGRDVGVLMRDRYWIWVNDACQFPNGNKGVYGRLLWVNSLEHTPGVAVMPLLEDGRVVLNCNYRHATRTWEIELPRGMVNRGEAVEAAARRETIEETGMLVHNMELLGNIPPDSGMTNSIIPIYLAHVVDEKEPEQEDSEAIEEILALTLSEVKQAFLRGFIYLNIRGVERKIYFRDPFLAYALLIYELRG